MNTISIIIMPTIIALVVLVGVYEKKEVYNTFCNGAIEGIHTLKSMFPTLIAVFLAIAMLRSSGIIDFVVDRMEYVSSNINIPKEIVPLMIIKPITGSGSLVMATDLMKKYGIDSRIGLLAGTIMSSSETTFYVIAMYLGSIKIKKSGKVLIPALIADLAMMITAILIIK